MIRRLFVHSTIIMCALAVMFITACAPVTIARPGTAVIIPDGRESFTVLNSMNRRVEIFVEEGLLASMPAGSIRTFRLSCIGGNGWSKQYLFIARVVADSGSTVRDRRGNEVAVSPGTLLGMESRRVTANCGRNNGGRVNEWRIQNVRPVQQM